MLNFFNRLSDNVKKAENLEAKANKLVYKNDPSAYKVFLEAGELFRSNFEKFEYKNCLSRAVNLMLKFELLDELLNNLTHKSTIIINDLGNILVEEGKYDKLGEIYLKISEIYEKKDELNLCIGYLKRTMNNEMYEHDDRSKEKTRTLKEKLALIYLKDKMFGFAVSLFEEIHYQNLSYGRSKYQHKIILCLLAMNDFVRAKLDFDQHGYLLSAYERILIEKVLLSIDENNIKHFEDACIEYEKIKSMEPWMVDILLHVKYTAFIADDETS